MDGVQEISRMLMSGFSKWTDLGRVCLRKSGDLVMFSYLEDIVDWTPFELISRGLIINEKTGEIVARPFDKFFGWGEGGRYSSNQIVSIYDKADGSAGILYRDGGQYKMSTRGGFANEQVDEATAILEKYDLANIPFEYTLVFEIIYPGNPNVIDYGSYRDLILIGVRNRFTGQYVPIEDVAGKFGFELPEKYDFETRDDGVWLIGNQGTEYKASGSSPVEYLLEVCKQLPGNKEGFVVEFSDGQRFKFKGRRYKDLKFWMKKNMFSRKIALSAMKERTVDMVRANTPPELLNRFDSWIEDIEVEIDSELDQVRALIVSSPGHESTQKEFAVWVNTCPKSIRAALFEYRKYGEEGVIRLVYERLR